MAESTELLARRYRRLLWAYPREYRRGRGAEIVGTLLDTAPPGRTRPELGEALTLVRHGMRCRLVVLAGLFAAVTAGVLGSVAGSVLAWQTAGPAPDNWTVLAILRTVLPGQPVRPADIGRQEYVLGYDWGTPSWRDVIVGADGFGPGYVGVNLPRSPRLDYRGVAAAARRRLRAAGWQVSRLDELREPGSVPVGIAQFTARRGGRVLEFEADAGDPAVPAGRAGGAIPGDPGQPAYLSVTLYRTTPGLVTPAEIAGALAGGLGGWLLFGWASRRTGCRRPPVRTAVGVLYAVALLGFVPMLVFTGFGLAVMSGMVSSQLADRWVPQLYWGMLTEPWVLAPANGALAAVLCCLAIAAFPVRRRAGRAGSGPGAPAGLSGGSRPPSR